LALSTRLAPVICRSTQGDTSQAQREQLSGIAQSCHKREREAAAGAVATDCYLGRGNPLIEEEMVGRTCILDGCREWVLGREPVSHRERTRAGRAPGFGYHAAMARDRA
jgi:hypothetical protein